ncbi:hypothetical protein D7231_29125 [Streptomyces klenkii]|uniref:Uncharacterized protein n=1 Tax=Streptomyces klenkii TaxID=1420899 RepID=A0A3B0AUM5_9ACTN|nr:DUF6114 domain-containing protein [Streptomyces klenkii]RKN64243.1 hypothetical protein D7231_29125 [Streptomyces klenkii]
MFLTRRTRGTRRRARFAAWRRTRPFWAGALLVLAGAEIAAVPLAPVSVLVGLGLGGVAALGIGAALVAAGLFLWFLPHTRHYVGMHAVILSVLSFAVTNLGGFLAGMLLGIAGGAMGFAWSPGQQPPAQASEQPAPEPPRLPDPDPGAAAHPPHKTLAVALPFVLLAATAVPAPGPRPPAPVPGSVSVPRTPPTVTTTRFTPDGFTLARVAEVPTADGPRRAMVLSMRAASLRDYRLRTRDGGGAELALDADELRLGGRVTLYLTRLTGCVQGILCLTFTPDRLPVPPVAPPFVFMTDVTAEQALVASGTIGAAGLALRPGRSPAPPPAPPPP